jgi:hypothetical protein
VAVTVVVITVIVSDVLVEVVVAQAAEVVISTPITSPLKGVQLKVDDVAPTMATPLIDHP